LDTKEVFKILGVINLLASVAWLISAAVAGALAIVLSAMALGVTILFGSVPVFTSAPVAVAWSPVFVP